MPHLVPQMKVGHVLSTLPLGVSDALYVEITSQTDTRPNVFILESTTSKNSPPTCIQ